LVDGTGRPPAPLRGAVALLTDFVRGSAATVAETRQARAETGVPDEEWWRARSAILAEVAPGFTGRYPALSRIEAEPPRPGEEPVRYLERKSSHACETGLALILDGLETATSRPTSARHAPRVRDVTPRSPDTGTPRESAISRPRSPE